MFKEYGRFKSFLILLLAVSLAVSFVSMAFGETVTKDVRENLKDIRLNDLVVAGLTLGYGYGVKIYVEPKGIIICISLPISPKDYKGITQKDLNSFFASLWKVFGTSKFPPNTRINFYIEISTTDSLIVEFPIGALYDFYKEKITRSDFLKKCDIWVNGEKATIKGDTIKALGKEFKMDFEF